MPGKGWFAYFRIYGPRSRRLMVRGSWVISSQADVRFGSYSRPLRTPGLTSALLPKRIYAVAIIHHSLVPTAGVCSPQTRGSNGMRRSRLTDISISSIAAASVKPSYLVQPQLRQGSLHALRQGRIRGQFKVLAQMLTNDR